MGNASENKVLSREVRSLEKRIERAEKKIKDLKEFKRSVQELIDKPSPL